METSKLLPFVIGLILGSGVLAYALSNFFGSIEVSGVFRIDSRNIAMEPQKITIDLGVVSEEKGSRVFEDVAKIKVYKTTGIIFKTQSSFKKPVDGGPEIIVSGKIELRGEDKTYTINMPCLYHIGECIRILVLIPGYDQPLKIDPGEYSVTLTISWQAKGSGETTVKFAIYGEEAEIPQ